MTFTTLKRAAPVHNRGFYALYEFSETFVKLGQLESKGLIRPFTFDLFTEIFVIFLSLDFIQDDAEHIKGMDCFFWMMNQNKSVQLKSNPWIIQELNAIRKF